MRILNTGSGDGRVPPLPVGDQGGRARGEGLRGGVGRVQSFLSSGKTSPEICSVFF